MITYLFHRSSSAFPTIFLVLVFLSLTSSKCKQGNDFYEDLAYRYAPVHYQDTDDTDAKADYITRFNYDGNWTGTDNWENFNSGDLSAWAYFSVVESETHWFIVYAFFHPRDWTDSSFEQEHENDLEGLLIFVRKDGSQFGKLEGMITMAHNHFFSYTPAGSPLTQGQHEDTDIDGHISFQTVDGIARPKTVQEAKGHGLYAWPYGGDFDGSSDQDGIIYFPSKTTSEVPSSGNDRSVKYRLASFDQLSSLWFFQKFEALNDRDQSDTFAKWGTIKGDKGGGCGGGLLNTVTCKEDAASTPWGWDDEDDGESYRGEVALDPAHLVAYYFNGLGDFSQKYVDNFYLEDLEQQGYKNSFPPKGWPDELDFDALYEKLANSN